jgi:hypothetical protein
VAELKLAKLPDRTPAKITITVSSDLNRALNRYAEIYRETYGESETVAELIPFMLDAFLDSDRGFAKARKSGARDGAAPPVQVHRREAVGTPLGPNKEPPGG